VRAEFLLSAATRRRLVDARRYHDREIDRICGMDQTVRLAQVVEKNYPNLVSGPYESQALTYGVVVVINCVVMRMDDVAPILAFLEKNGWEAMSSSDSFGRRKHVLSKGGETIRLDCYPDEKNGSNCRLVPTGKYVGGYYPVQEYVCDDPEEAGEKLNA